MDEPQIPQQPLYDPMASLAVINVTQNKEVEIFAGGGNQVQLNCSPAQNDTFGGPSANHEADNQPEEEKNTSLVLSDRNQMVDFYPQQPTQTLGNRIDDNDIFSQQELDNFSELLPPHIIAQKAPKLLSEAEMN